MIKNFLIKKYISILFFIMSIILSFSLFSVTIIVNHLDFVKTQLENNLIGKTSTSIEELCLISNCSKVYSDVYGTILNQKGKLIKVNENLNDKLIFEIKTGIYIDSKLDFIIKIDKVYSHFIIENKQLKNVLLNNFLIFSPITIFVFILFTYNSFLEDRKSSIRLLAGNEALLSNKSMILITENVHHELNTPLEILENKIDNIKQCFVDWDLGRNKKVNSLKTYDDFKYIDNSLDSVKAILNRMRGFKHLKYSNGNKSLYDIIEGVFKFVNFSESIFEYQIDNKLKLFSINEEFGLTNGDLFNIILNHIKNSLEANSTKIYIIFNESRNNLINVRIIDNGNGIPKEKQKNIFEPNFSTKESKYEIRGNGLFLNKDIIESAGGRVRLIESSIKGTTFELRIQGKAKEVSFGY